MNNAQKILVTKLLKGHFLVASISRDKKVYRLLDSKVNPIGSVSAVIVDKMDCMFSVKIWKKDKWGRKTLNLSNVRKLHGSCTLKKMYKNREALEDFMVIKKSRNNKKIITKKDQNEKVLTLF